MTAPDDDRRGGNKRGEGDSDDALDGRARGLGGSDRRARETTEAALGVTCPTCAAPAGERCVDLRRCWGGWYRGHTGERAPFAARYPHRPRTKAAERAAKVSETPAAS